MKKGKVNKDILGIEPYANAIVDAIDNFFKEKEDKRESSFNILISAQWGMGKTFILRRIDKELRDIKGFKTFKFNPWKYSQSPIAIKRKFLQELHKEFGGRVNLDSLYEGIEGEKQRSLVAETTFIASGVFRMLIYSSLISIAIWSLLNSVVAKFPSQFENFFFILFKLLKVNAELKAQNYLLEIAIVFGLLGALIPAVKFVFENVSIKTKKAEVDSLEQFEEIFSKIIEQKKHATILGFLNLTSKILNLLLKLLAWDIFFLAWLDERKLRPYKLYQVAVKRISQLMKNWWPKIEKFLEKHPNLKSLNSTIVLWAKKFKEKMIDVSVAAMKEKRYPKVAILIDDLDRCEEKEVKNILDGFLTFFEKKNCAYIVTADHTVIERHIGNQLRLDQDRNSSAQEVYSSPKEYLHKIFNLNFLVPYPPKNNLETFLKETAATFVLKSNKHIANFAYKFFNRNPRAIRRFYTKVKFDKDVAQNLENNPKAEKERKLVASKVLEKPELKAKITALEMVSPKFFSLISKAPQIAEDCEALENIDRSKPYFEGSESVDARTKDWTEQEKEEINKAEEILTSEPSVNESGLGYEMLISFSSSTYSAIRDTFDWSQIQQDMEKGSSVFQKVYRGTTDKGRLAIRKQALERYKTLKSEKSENRHLFPQGLIEVALASYRKGDNVMDWGTEILNELSNEPEDNIVKIEPKDYARLLEAFKDNPNKEKEVLLKLLSTDPFRKPSINPNIFQVSDTKVIRDEDGKPSSVAKSIIKHASAAFSATLEEEVDSGHQETLIEVFTENYQAEEQSIPQNHRINYLNSLIGLLTHKQDSASIKQTINSIKQRADKEALLTGITQNSWGLIMSTLSSEDTANYLSDAELAPAPIKTNILEGIANRISNWDISKTLKLLENIKPSLASLPQPREQLSGEQALVLQIFVEAISTQQVQKNTDIRKFTSEVISSFLAILNEEEKDKIVSFYQASVEATESLSQLQEIKDEAEKAGLSDIANTADKKIKSIKKKQAK